MSSKKKSVKLLNRMNKAGDQVYDGLNSNSPTLFPGGNFNDGYRKIEIQNINNTDTKEFIDNLELSRRLMAIDCEKYNVEESVRSRLMDYIEDNDFDVTAELEMEFKIKQKKLKEKVKELAEIDIDDYLTEEDYTRVVTDKRKDLIKYSNRLMYLQMVITTIKRYKKELEELEEFDNMDHKPDFSYNFTNQNPSFDAGKLK